MKEVMKEVITKLKEADAVLIGASNGLSISEGLHLFAENQTFMELFSDFREKYGIHNILQGMFFKYHTEEESWAFWSRLIKRFVCEYRVTENMETLRKLTEGKPYFIVTSNGEGHFGAAGFDSQNIYEMEGNFVEMQCSKGCHNKLYPADEAAEKMVAVQKDCKVPSELIPHCPVCGGSMQVHSVVCPHFLVDHEAAENFQAFLKRFHGKRLFILELGIGWRNQMIKAPLMELCRQEKKAVYVTINKGEIYIQNDIKEKSYGLDGDMTEILAGLRQCMEQG